MPQFHETGYGRKFFDGQLPRLIDALERIAKALEVQVTITTEDNEEVLKDEQ